MAVLERIEAPSDLHGLTQQELIVLAEEMREIIIRVVSENTGHLASNLGAIELTIALHRVFNSPEDTIVWDVGHQTYAHKLLTGRREAFATLRKLGGLSGFARREESLHDAFGAGHASTALSAALGILRANMLQGKEDKVIAVVGDGAFTGGMCYEALNDAGNYKEPLIAILNDNEMSISQNVGALQAHLTNLRSNPTYWKIKRTVYDGLLKVPVLGKSSIHMIDATKNMLRSVLVPGEYFEALGWKYLGPIDGHSIADVERVLMRARTLDKPVVVHVITKKGKGYSPAEKEPTRYHGVPSFQPENGVGDSHERSCASVACKQLISLAEEDERIVAITAAMAEGTGLAAYAQAFPDRYYDVGIAEEHAVTMAAGMAAGGMRPWFAVYSTFLQRSFDQVLHDVGLQNLPVNLLIDRSGIGGEDGYTHHGVYDLAYLRMIPNMTLLVPRDERMLMAMMAYAQTLKGPCAIRYPKRLPRGFGPGQAELPQWQVVKEYTGGQSVVLACGRMVELCLQAIERIESRYRKLRIGLVDALCIKPLDAQMLESMRAVRLCTVEDGIYGGLSGAVLEHYAQQGQIMDIQSIAVEDTPLPHGSNAELTAIAGLDVDALTQRLSQWLGVR